MIVFSHANSYSASTYRQLLAWEKTIIAEPGQEAEAAAAMPAA